LRRHLEAIGLKRVSRDITPTLDDIAEEIAAGRDGAAIDEEEDVAS